MLRLDLAETGDVVRSDDGGVKRQRVGNHGHRHARGPLSAALVEGLTQMLLDDPAAVQLGVVCHAGSAFELGFDNDGLRAWCADQDVGSDSRGVGGNPRFFNGGCVSPERMLGAKGVYKMAGERVFAGSGRFNAGAALAGLGGTVPNGSSPASGKRNCLQGCPRGKPRFQRNRPSSISPINGFLLFRTPV